MASAWTPELKQEVIDAYLAQEPTPENSAEIVNNLAEQFEQTPNGVRLVLIQAQKYVRKEAATSSGEKSTTKKTKTDSDKPARSSKSDQINKLVDLIKSKGHEPDMEILEKLTGKAAGYLATVLA